ncbi:MAG: transglycosylase SLT domain-containing protein [Bacteroidales bacterium]|nr:transglycosylase SLT domain-containing protein [Bacteroidales bacterium]
MRYTKIITICTLIAIMGLTHAQEPDSIDLSFDDPGGVETNFDANLDSLQELWYVGESVDTIETVAEPEEEMPLLTDELLMERLSKIPSVVPLSYNTIVRRYIEMYTGKRAELVKNMLGLADYYFPVFEDIFDYYQVPVELKYLSIIESALNPRAYSRARAVGLWQFMYGTGRLYGLTVNSHIDERMDPIKSTHAAARFLKDLYKRYGDWTLAIAAYNCGPGNVNKAIRRSGGKTNYWDIYFYLPRETRGYVPAFIAATYVMNYYSEHSFVPAKIDLPLASDTIMVTEPLHFQQVANVLSVPLKQIRDMNPQYRVDIIPASLSKPMPLKLPDTLALAFIDHSDSIYAYRDSVYFNSNNLSVSPTRYSHSSYAHVPPGDNMAAVHYKVKPGDNLGYISEWYNVRISDLRYWNNIRNYNIRADQKLVIYVPKSKLSKYSNINNMSFAEKQRMIGKEVSPGTSSTTSSSVQPAVLDSSNYIYYTVREGDTLWDIAKKFPGVSDQDIKRLNNITDVSKIRPGQKLKIKPKA